MSLFSLRSLTMALSLAVAATVFVAPQAAQAQASAPAAEAPAVVAAPAAPVAVPGAVTKESVDNPYGLSALWAQGDFVARGTLIILVIMSMGSWYILVTKLFESFKISGEARAARKSFFKSASLNDGVATLKDGSAFRFIAETGVEANDHHEGALTEHIDRNSWVTMSVQRAVDDVQSRLQDGLAFLATVGSTAPFVGLFGTVWGIYHALLAIATAGGIPIEKVAGPVGEALVMTAAGLAVAIPAVLAYNVFGKWLGACEAELEGFAHDLREIALHQD
jgi:biopolymer transport protein ExbB